MCCCTATAAGAAGDPPLPTRLATVEAALAKGTKGLLADLQAWVAIPSISADPSHAADVEAAAAWIAHHMTTKVGLGNVTTLRAGKSPAVIGEWLGRPGAPTVLLYGHGDVQPADGATDVPAWTSPPFKPTLRGGALYGRGASDDKACLAALAAVGAWIRDGGGPPVNVKVFIEFQEEVGSPDMGPFLAAHASRLAADLALSADGSQPGPGVGAVVSGLRGAAAFEVRIRTLTGDVHSGSFGGSVANAAHVMASAIASLHDSKGHRVSMKGFYDGVSRPSKADLAAVAAYEASPYFDGPAELEALGAAGGPVGEVGYSTLARRWLRPTCDVVGAGSGFGGEGIKTIVPAAAFFKVACRLVPGQDPDTILAVARAHFARLAIPGAPPGSLEFAPLPFKATPYRLPPASPAAAAARAVLESVVGSPDKVFQNWMGGSIPATAHFKAALGLETALLGFGLPTDRVHAPDEHVPIAQLEQAQIAYARALAELAEPGVLAAGGRGGGGGGGGGGEARAEL